MSVATNVVQLGNGKWLTYFDNAVIPCVNDFNCTLPESICLTTNKVSWVNESSCACSPSRGKQGLDCKELSAGGVALVSLEFVIIFLCAVILGKFSYYAYLLYAKKMKMTLNAIQTTYISLFVSVASLLCWMCASVARSLYRSVNEEDTRNNKKNAYLDVFSNVFGVFFLMFYIIALLNISVVWIEISRQSTHLTAKVSKNLNYYARSVYLFEASVAIICAVLLALPSSEDGAGLAWFLGIVFAFIALTFVYGAYQIIKVLKLVDGFNTSRVGGNLSSSDIHLQMKQILQTSLALVILMVITIAIFIVLGVTGGQEDDGNPPNFPVGTFVYRFAALMPALGYFVLDRYIAIRLLGRGNKASATSSKQVGGPDRVNNTIGGGSKSNKNRDGDGDDTTTDPSNTAHATNQVAVSPDVAD